MASLVMDDVIMKVNDNCELKTSWNKFLLIY